MRVLLQKTAGPNLETDDIGAEVKRLESLGASRDHQQECGYDFWVMRDAWGE